MKLNVGVILWLAVCLLGGLIVEVWSLHGKVGVLTYTRDQLLSLRHPVIWDSDLDSVNKFPELRNTGTRIRTRLKKRGSRGGVRERIRRRGSRHPLPVITFSNVRSLSNKMNELLAKVRYDSEFRQSNLICFTESWLKEDMPDPNLPGYTMIRADRDINMSRKSIGGGLCVYVDERWATQYTVRERVCTHDYEILVVSFRPFYCPREFGQITIILAYVPGPDFVGAAARIAESYNTALSRAVNQPVLCLGDFNSCDLSDHLPTLHQYVDCPTRLARTLDKCYGNIPDAYKFTCRPALGKSDHYVIHLLPRYRAVLKREKTVTKEITTWTEDCREEMRCELETTDWLFLNSCETPHELIDTFTSYLLFNES